MVTEKPLACRSLAKEAAMMPLPREEVTPPVTKMYLVMNYIEDAEERLRDTKLDKKLQTVGSKEKLLFYSSDIFINLY